MTTGLWLLWQPGNACDFLLIRGQRGDTFSVCNRFKVIPMFASLLNVYYVLDTIIVTIERLCFVHLTAEVT